MKWKNWGGFGDFVMITALMILIVEAASSHYLGSNFSGPFVLLDDVIHGHWDHNFVGGLFLFWVTAGSMFYMLHNTGRNGCIYFYSENGEAIKEAQPFSTARGYGKWQAFYYAFFLILLFSMFYGFLKAVYYANPAAHLPDNLLSAWVFAWHHPHLIYQRLYHVGSGVFILGFLTWAFRAYPKNLLYRLGILRIHYWYLETEDEVRTSEEISRIAELHTAAMIASWHNDR